MRAPFHRKAGIVIVVVSAIGLSSACGGSSAEPPTPSEEPEAEAKPPGVIALTPKQFEHARITTARVDKRAEAGLLLATAQIEPAADGVAHVGTRLASRIVELKAGVGDHVTKDAVLATVDAPELGRAKADYQAAVVEARVTRESAERAKALVDEKVGSERERREAEANAAKARAEKDAAENRLRSLGLGDKDLGGVLSERPFRSTMQVSAPLDGIVVERPVTLGQMVEPGDMMFTLMDLRSVWVLVDVFEQDLAQMKVGQGAVVRVAAFRDRTFTGEVTNIGATVEPKTRTVKVRVVVPNPAEELRPGMFAEVELAGTTGEKREALYVPSGAVQRDGDRHMIFVERGEREYERRYVTLGRPAGALVAVQSGLSAGEAVVVEGSFILKSELQKGELGEDE